MTDGDGPPTSAVPRRDFACRGSRRSALPAADYNVDFADVIGRGLTELGVDVRGERCCSSRTWSVREPVRRSTRIRVAVRRPRLRRAGAREVLVGEGPGHRRDIEYLLSSTGLSDHQREAPFVDLNHDDVRKSAAEKLVHGLRSLALPAAVLERTSSSRCPS